MAKPKVSHLQETQKSDQQIGTLIAAVLAHPDLPEKVYDGIVDGLNELQTREVSRRAEFIQALVDGHNELEKVTQDEKGGAQ